MRLGPTKTLELFVGPINGPKRFGFNEFSSDFAGKIAGTKKPAGLAPCGLSGLHRMTLVITDGECLVELAGVEPASEIPTSSALHA